MYLKKKDTAQLFYVQCDWKGRQPVILCTLRYEFLATALHGLENIPPDQRKRSRRNDSVWMVGYILRTPQRSYAALAIYKNNFFMTILRKNT